MFKLYNKQEMMTQFALKIVRTAPEFQKTGDQFTLPKLGLCDTYFLPIRYAHNDRTDEIVGFIPVNFEWCEEPFYYAFLSEMNANATALEGRQQPSNASWVCVVPSVTAFPCRYTRCLS